MLMPIQDSEVTTEEDEVDSFLSSKVSHLVDGLRSVLSGLLCDGQQVFRVARAAALVGLEKISNTYVE